MDAEQALTFLVFSTVAAITPGPSNVMLAAAGAAGGVVRGLPCLFGVGVGMATMLFAVALGLGEVVLGHPMLIVSIQSIGTAFLLWLSWKIATAPYQDIPTGAGDIGFASAFTFQWLNPKSWLVSASAVGTNLRPDEGHLAQAMWISGLFIAAALPSGFVWLAFGVAMRRLLNSPQRRRVFNQMMGLLLAASVVLLLR